MSALIAWCVANQALIATVLFALSEAMGANTKFKSNGVLSLDYYTKIYFQEDLKLRSSFFINIISKFFYE